MSDAEFFGLRGRPTKAKFTLGNLAGLPPRLIDCPQASQCPRSNKRCPECLQDPTLSPVVTERDGTRLAMGRQTWKYLAVQILPTYSVSR